MAQNTPIDLRYKGENISFAFFAKNRKAADAAPEDPYTALTDPASATIRFDIMPKDGETPVVSLDTVAVLDDAPTAKFTVTITPAMLTGLTEGLPYFYNLWAEVSGDDILQNRGDFIYRLSSK